MSDNVFISSQDNNVSLSTTNNILVITDSDQNQITVTQPVTKVIEINVPGPQGKVGPSGSFDSISGSFVTTASFNAFTSSYYIDSASFNTKSFNNSASIAILSSSYQVSSASFDSRISNLSSSLSTLSASYLSSSSSFDARLINNSSSIANLSSSYLTFSGSYNTGSFTGSFTGVSNLTSLTASSTLVTGNVTVLGTASINTLIVNQTQLSTGSNQLGDTVDDFQTLYGTVRIPTGSLTVTGSVNITGSTTVAGNIIPTTSSTYDIGNNITRFRNGYFTGDLVSTNNIITSNLWAGTIKPNTGGNSIVFRDTSNNAYGVWFMNTGNLLIQNGGILTDNNYKLQINTTGSELGSLFLGGTSVATGGVGRTMLISSSLNASANNDSLTVLEINPTFTNGSFTGVKNNWINLIGNAAINGTNQIYLRRGDVDVFFASSAETQIKSISSTVPLRFFIGTTKLAEFFATTGNFGLQNGGVFIDNGYRLQINATGLESGSLFIGGTNIASGSIARTVLISSSLSASANNDVLIGLDVNPSFAVGSFIGVLPFAARFNNGRIQLNNSYFTFGNSTGASTQLTVSNLTSYNQNFNFGGSGGILNAQIFNNTGNWLFQTSGSFLDNNYKIQINATSSNSGSLFVGGVTIATGSIARTMLISSSLSASANNDVLVGLDINPTFTNGAFTGVTNYALRVNGDIVSPNTSNIGTGAVPFRNGVFNNYVFGAIFSGYSGGFYLNVGGINFGRFHTTTGNFQLQNGGTFVDNGYRLDISGSTRITDNLIVTGSVTAASFTGSFSGSLSGISSTASYVLPLTQSVIIKGTGTTSATTTLTIQNTNNSASFTVRDDGVVYANGPGYTLTNTIFGYNAFSSNTTGSNITAFGTNALKFSTGDNNTAVGASTLGANLTGYGNTAIGSTALALNTIGNLNTAVGFNTQPITSVGNNNTSLGHESLRLNTSGSGNVSIGVYSLYNNVIGVNNIAVGNATLFSNSGSYNTAIGHTALYKTTGSGNVAIGQTALYNYSGSNNVAIGFEAAYLNVSGTGVTAVGNQALRSNTGANNTALGYQAGLAITTGGNNTVLGYQSAVNTTSGGDNTAVGVSALYFNLSGSFNTAIGRQALQNNTAPANTAVGSQASLFNTSGTGIVAIGYAANYANTTGSNITAIGYQALVNNSGSNNTAVGHSTLLANTTGVDNVAIGYQAGNSITIGFGNTHLGTYAGKYSTNSSGNTFLGYYAGQTGGGSNNVAVGYNTLIQNQASNNTAVGMQAGYLNTIGTGIVAIGYQAAYSSSTVNNITAIGYQALFNNTGSDNTAIGYQAAINNTTGNANIALGAYSLNKNTTFGSNIAIGNGALYLNNASSNIGIGYEAGRGNTTGTGIVAIGYQAAWSSSTAINITAIGYQALYNNTGSYNTAVGYQTLLANTSGANNSALGYLALSSNILGNSNVAIGHSALLSNAGNDNSTAVGYFALKLNTATANTAVGASALRDNVTGTGLVAVGYQALVQSTGNNNTAVGYQAGFANNIGTQNTAVGTQALFTNNIGSNHTAFGFNALYSNTVGVNNSAFGANALQNNTSGSDNVAIGINSLQNNTIGQHNIAIGISTLTASTTGSYNIAIGRTALFNLINGGENTALGVTAARFIADGTTTLTSANTSIFIGNNTKALANSQNNQIVIGYNSVGLGSNTTVLGNTSITQTHLFGSTTIGSSTFSPLARLHVLSSGTTSATNAVVIQNASSTTLLTIRDDSNTSINGSTQITGSLNISASAGTGSAFSVYKSGSTVVSIQGSQGELFSITDSLSGSLFSVSNISGLPIVETFSDNTTLIGNYIAPMLITTQKLTINSGSTVIYSLPTSSYDGAFFEYTIKSGSNARAGQIMGIWSGTSVNFTDNSTTDFGSTSGFTFGMVVSGSNMILTGSTTTSGWTLKTIIRSI